MACEPRLLFQAKSLAISAIAQQRSRASRFTPPSQQSSGLNSMISALEARTFDAPQVTLPFLWRLSGW